MIHQVETQIFVLLLIASIVGMTARKLRLPYTLALVAAGLALGLMHLDALRDVRLSPEVLMMLLLPALLFEASIHIDLRELRSSLASILTLAGPGVLVSVAVTAPVMYGLAFIAGFDGFGWPHAILFAAIVSATDPISVLALFREIGVSRKLYLLVEGESLLNDGAAVVVFLIVGAVLGLDPTQGALLGWDAVGFGIKQVAWMVGGGVAIGAMIGIGASVLTRQVDDHLVETALTMVVAYGSFLLAEQVHASGVLSTVAAGLAIGSLGRSYGMSVTTRVAMEDFWSFAAFLANSFVFLLVGIEIQPEDLFANAGPTLLAFVAVLVGRAVMIYGLSPLLKLSGHPVPTPWRHVLVWGGLRGSLSMVLALSLPVTFAGRSQIVAVVFGVVALSLFLQGLTVAPLLRRLGLQRGVTSRHAYDRARGAMIAIRQALAHLGEMEREGVIQTSVAITLREGWDRRAAQAEAQTAALAAETEDDGDLAEGLRRLVDTEQEVVRDLARSGVISPSAAAALQAELNEREIDIDEAERSDEDRHAALLRIARGPS